MRNTGELWMKDEESGTEAIKKYVDFKACKGFTILSFELNMDLVQVYGIIEIIKKISTRGYEKYLYVGIIYRLILQVSSKIAILKLHLKKDKHQRLVIKNYN